MANPTSNFGWQMPTATDLVTDLPADFEVFGQAVDTDFVDLLGGTTGQILSKTSATDLDFTWINNDQGDITGVTAGTGISVTSPTGPVPTVAIDTAVTVDKTTAQTLTNKTLTSPALTTPTISTATTNGDLLYGTGSGALQRLGIGSASQVLTVASGIPSWATPSGSKVVQIINATNGTQTITSSSTFADSNLSATITPTSASNKILVFVTQSGCGKYNSQTAIQVRLVRGSTTILNIESNAASTGTTAENLVGSISATYLDSPATTSATTYKTQIASRGNTGSAYINDAVSPGSNSSITLMEVTP